MLPNKSQLSPLEQALLSKQVEGQRGIALNTRTAKKAGEKIKEYIPDWLENFIPTDTDVSDTVNPMAAVAAIPPKVAKQFARNTGAMLKDAAPTLYEAWEFMRKRYPRVMGHVTELRLPNESNNSLQLRSFAGEQKSVAEELADIAYLRNEGLKRPEWGHASPIKGSRNSYTSDGLDAESVIAINQFGRSKHNSDTSLLKTLAHELNHAAQQISLKGGMSDAYSRNKGAMEASSKKAEDLAVARKHDPRGQALLEKEERIRKRIQETYPILHNDTSKDHLLTDNMRENIIREIVNGNYSNAPWLKK